MKSIWENTVSLPKFPQVNKDLETDVLIIGGGICGILCAKKLHDNGVNYILVEADEICKKTTANTTAKISSLHGILYSRLIKEVGEEKAKLYYKAHDEAIKEYEELCKNIECDFEKTNAYVFTSDNKENILKEYEAITKLGINAHFETNLDIPFKSLCGIKLENQAQFNPLKFIHGICKDLNIYENSKATGFIDDTPIVNGYKIHAKKIIVATHFPFINKHGLYFLKMFQHRSYAIAIKTDKAIKGMYISDTEFGLSLREYKGMIILGGEGHRTGKSSNAWKGLENIADKYFPGNKIVNRWATQDCITLDGMMYAGRYSPKTPNLYVATGFNKWGMTSSMVAANLLCNMIMGKGSVYEELYDPSRTILRKQLLLNAFETLMGWLCFWNKRCPHLGCSLKWNKQERTWDCPCHGSRFDRNGHLLDGPSNHDVIK